MKKGALIFLLIISINFVCANVIINEIMPNPNDDCSDCSEWIELYSDSEVNLTDYIINTTKQSQNFSFYLKDFLIITRNKQKFLESFYNIDSLDQNKIIELKTIRLVNSGSKIFLFNNLSLEDSVEYTDFSSIQNKSYSRYEGEFEKCIPSPLKENCDEFKDNEEEIVQINTINITDNEEDEETSEDTNNSKKIIYVKIKEIKLNSSENDNIEIEDKNDEINSSSEIIQEKIIYLRSNLSNDLENKIIYESNTQIAKKYSIFLFEALFIFIMIIIYRSSRKFINK